MGFSAHFFIFIFTFPKVIVINVVERTFFIQSKIAMMKMSDVRHEVEERSGRNAKLFSFCGR